MKKGFIVLFSMILIASLSCATGSNITVKDDEFTKAKTITMYARHGIKDWSFFMLYVFECEYYREIKAGRALPATISMTLMGTTLVDNIKRNAMIKADGKIFNIPIQATTESRKDTSTTAEISRTSGSVSAKSESSEYKQFKLLIRLTPAIQNAMANSSSILYRFSAGTKPVTIELDPKEVEQVKQFLTLKPE